MHELSIALSILDLAQEEAARRDPDDLAHVLAVHISLGPLSGISKNALISAFELAREGTPLSACQLVVTEIPVTGFCPNCRADRRVISIQEHSCGICGTVLPHIVTGEELELTAMEFAA